MRSSPRGSSPGMSGAQRTAAWTGATEQVREAGLSYVLPLRWREPRELGEMGAYLRWLAGRCDVVIVDASPEPLALRHRETWGADARIVPPDPAVRCLNGKAWGVMTGVPLARHERVVVADDDVRYDAASLARLAAMLAEHDLVWPHCYFDPLPWHARWDTARSLLNRSLGADPPGTLGVRRSRFLAMGGYDGGVLFENLELLRTVRAHGGMVACPRDLLVRRLPPTARHFLAQRVRQAYDDLAQPARLAAVLAALPAVALSRRPVRTAGLIAAAGIALAEVGRRRGGRRPFPPSSALWAPLWMAERAVCGWLALGQRLTRGGTVYAGRRLRTAATSNRRLRARAKGAG